MKIAITSNIVIDFVHNVKGMISKSLSGPACYCRITARQFGFEVCLATKISKIKQNAYYYYGTVLFRNHDA
jgi:hypothetical protein